MKKSLLLALIFLVCSAAAAAAQTAAIMIPAPVPALSNNCVFQYNATTEELECNALGAASQPLTDSSPLIANAANATKLLAFDLAGISSATTRTWTIPDANLTIPSTIASLGVNTFTGLQTLNGGLAATTGTFSSTLGVTGLATFTGGLATNTIAERTAASGVTIDGVLLKDGAVTLAGALAGATTGAFSGNVTVGGTLGVTGASTIAALSATTGTFSSTLGVTGAFTGTTGTFSTTLGVGAAPTASLHVQKSDASFLVRFENSNASPNGLFVNYTAAAPGGTANYFVRADDTGGIKFQMRGNGGLANFSANDVNLSDERTKDLVGPVESLRERFSQIQLYRGRYKASTREAADVMWTAQEIAAIDPNWSEVFQHEERDAEGNIVLPELLGTRDNQIFMANVAVTIEHETLITALQQQLSGLKSRVDQLAAALGGIVQAAINIPAIGRIH